jgi:hypothetical protein
LQDDVVDDVFVRLSGDLRMTEDEKLVDVQVVVGAGVGLGPPISDLDQFSLH